MEGVVTERWSGIGEGAVGESSALYPIRPTRCCVQQVLHLVSGIPYRRQPPSRSHPLPLSRSRTAAAATLAFLAPCAPASAGAPVTITPLKRCYVSVAEGRTEPVRVSAAGFAAGAPVDVRLDGTRVATMTSTADGRIDARVTPPHPAGRQQSFRIVLVQRGDRSHRVAVASRVTVLAATLRPRAARPRSVVTWTGRGFTAPGPVYVHYLKDGEVRRSIRVAVPRRPCGLFRVRRAQFPFQPGLGDWVLQVDQQRVFAPIPGTPFVQLPVTVRRVPNA